MEEYNWYSQLIKPHWAPPAYLFGPVWTFLYEIIIISFCFVFYKIQKAELNSKIATPFILNIIFNLSFTPIQFGLKNNLLASIDIILVLLTILWMFIAIWKHYKWIALANIPYFLWVAFATTLQITITYLNI
jgi:tryptophan-rich sensory protein